MDMKNYIKMNILNCYNLIENSIKLFVNLIYRYI